MTLVFFSVVELFDGIVQVGRTPKWDALWRYFVALRNISGIAQMKRAEMLWRTHPKSAELFNSTVCNVLVHLYLKDNRRDESERVLKLMAESVRFTLFVKPPLAVTR
jgi:pentatricopeptide repeat protein